MGLDIAINPDIPTREIVGRAVYFASRMIGGYCLVFSHGATSYLAQGASDAELAAQFGESSIAACPVLFHLSTG